jgi:vanillate/3-O-methylgallate O-demethylase
MTDPAPFRAFTGIAPVGYFPVMGPPEHSGWMDEQLSWHTDCYVGDWSFVPQIRFKGPDALKLFRDLSVNDFVNFPVGKAKHVIQCNDDGKVISEGILLRHAEDDFEYQVGTPQWSLYNARKGGYDVEVSFPLTHKFQVSGPKALGVIEKLTETGLRDVKFMNTRQGVINDIDVTFLRQGMAGEIGFEIQGPIENHGKVLEAILEAGKDFGIRRLGTRTFMINHLEACYPTGAMHFFNALSDESKADYHKFMDENLPPEWVESPFNGPLRHNFSTSFDGSWDGDDLKELYRSPIEMGWGRNIAFDHDFPGREALEKEAANPRRQVVTLEFNSEDVKRIHASLYADGPVYQQFDLPEVQLVCNWVDWILKDGKKIGHATHPGYSRWFRKTLALSFIDTEYAEPGTEVTVLWGKPGTPQTEIRATVAPAPYKKDSRRRDLSTEPALAV